MAETELEILNGVICGVLFQNYENGYAVLKLNCQDGRQVTVVGTIPMPTVGEQLMVTGKWSSHPNYGKQFEAEFLERLLPQTEADIIAFLAGRVIKGIGPKIAARIVARFHENTLTIMEREPHRLAEISGISHEKAIAIGEAFRTQIGMRQLIEFFALHGLPAELGVRVYKVYGESTIDMLYDDPYLLMDEGFDAPFGAVDHFAIELGVNASDPKRVSAGILFELHYNLNAGHSFLPLEKLVNATAQLLSIEDAAVLEAIDQLTQAQRIVIDKMLHLQIVYLPELYEAEVYCARRLLTAAGKPTIPVQNMDILLAQTQQNSQVQYSQLQFTAIRQAAESSLLMITGGPGTGKTTILNGILDLYNRMGLKCLLAAPTGRAAKRLSELAGQDASTIHRLLEAGIDPFSGKLFFSRDASNPLKADAVIIDEMSMVDVRLLHSLLLAVPEKCRLIFVGDPDQLPPVGPGFPFSDMLRSGVLPSVRLVDIFRQAQESLIVMNAHNVNNGILPELRNRSNDFFFLRARSEEEVGQIIAGLCQTRLPQNMGIPQDQIQVLSPSRRGGAGTAYLNKLLQAHLNPSTPTKRERTYGDVTFRVGDRVMQIRNNYDILWKHLQTNAIGTGIFNGDIGIITGIQHEAEQLTVVFDDREVNYDFTQLNELEPAYAITVHKSQGSEYRAVIIAAWNHSAFLLNRSVLYTAITRAKELLIIVGREDTVKTMTENAKVSRRYSGLKLRLQQKEDAL